MRESTYHWKRLSNLLNSFERCVEYCSRLDAHRLPQEGLRKGPRYETNQGRIRIECSIDSLAVRIERELDIQTAERLALELILRMEADRLKQEADRLKQEADRLKQESVSASAA